MKPKKKTSPKSKKPQLQRMKPPAGYAELQGEFAPTWEPAAKGDMIEGTVMGYRVFKAKKKGDSDGVILTLSHEGLAQDVRYTANLRQKIGDYKKVKGRHFMIIYLGSRVIKKGQQPMKEYQVFEKKRGAK